MPRRRNIGPGPKSKTTLKNKHSSFLGDSTATEVSDAESFQSVELEPDHTDYGFNYTSTTSSPRISRKSVNQSATPRQHVQKESRPSEKGQRSNRSNPQQNSPQARNIPPPKSKSRKQRNPLNREQVLWNEIRKLQKRTDNLTPKAPFGRLIREIIIQESSYATRITYKALEALQFSSEMYLTNLFSDAYVCTLHRGRVTLGVHDVRLVRFLRGPSDSGNN